MGLIARELEKQGITTIMVTLLPDITKELGVPRAIYFPNKLGSPIGRPNQKEEQYDALRLCLETAAQAKKGGIIQASGIQDS